MKKTLMATAVALAFICQGALASTYNFVDLIEGTAVGTFEGTLADGTVVAPYAPGASGIGEAAYKSASWTVDGRTITLTGTGTDPSDSSIRDEFAYFDSISGGRPAGVGVCPKIMGSNQCDPSSDDNAKVGETLKASFGGAVDVAVDDLVFRDSGHYLYANSALSSLYVAVTGGIDGGLVDTIANLANLVPGRVLNGSMFEFYTMDNSQQFYLSSLTATPLPAAFLLFGAGLLGLFGAGRARSNQSS